MQTTSDTPHYKNFRQIVFKILKGKLRFCGMGVKDASGLLIKTQLFMTTMEALTLAVNQQAHNYAFVFGLKNRELNFCGNNLCEDSKAEANMNFI